MKWYKQASQSSAFDSGAGIMDTDMITKAYQRQQNIRQLADNESGSSDLYI
jgi:hypothetical protein